MAELRHYLNNALAPPPEGWETQELELSFENDTTTASIRTDGGFTFMAENAKLLNDWRKAGLAGGVGLFEGPPYRVETCDNPAQVVMDGCLKMTSAQTRFSCDKVQTSVEEKKTIDWLRNRADSFSFATLADLGLITTADYIAVPYVVSTIPNYTQMALLSVAMVQVIKELEETVKRIGDILTDLSGDTTSAAATSGLTLATPAADVIKVEILIVYLLAIIVALILLILQIIDSLIQPLKYKYGMKLPTLFSKATSYLGVGFTSSILQTAPYKDLVVIPKKISFETDPSFLGNFFGNTFSRRLYDDTLNPAAFGYYEGTFGDLIREFRTYFNAKTDMINGVLVFERRDFIQSAAAITLPPASSEAPFSHPYGTNASELTRSYLISYALDDAEDNTYDDYTGQSCEMILDPVAVTNQLNLLFEGITEKRFNLARVRRKTKFTIIEQVFQFFYNIISTVYNAIANFFNTIIGAINGIISAIAAFISIPLPTIPSLPLMPPNIINQRIGAMLISTDFFGVPKVFVATSTGHVDPNNQSYTSAKTLSDRFHYVNYAIDTVNGDHNQYLTFHELEIPFCCSDFIKLKVNNLVTTSDGKIGRVDSLRWNPHLNIAIINYRVKEKFTNNLTQRFIIDGVA